MRLGPKALRGVGLPAALRPYAPLKGVGGPPFGFIFLTDSDGAILTDDDGAYLMEAI